MRMICSIVGARPNFMKMAPVILESQRRRLTQLGKKIWRRVLSIDLLALISGTTIISPIRLHLQRRSPIVCQTASRRPAIRMTSGNSMKLFYGLITRTSVVFPFVSQSIR
jgi:hypothetical protein